MTLAALWLLAGSPAHEVPELQPAGFLEDLLTVEEDHVKYALELRDKEPGGLPVRIRRRRLARFVPAEEDPFVLKVAPWPMSIGGGLKLGAKF